MPIDFHRFDKSAKPLYLGIADELARQIRDGGLTPGEKLMTHRDLSTLLGIARSTVRRAYEELTRRRLVEAGFGRGTFVRQRPSALQSVATEGPDPAPVIDLAHHRCCVDHDRTFSRMMRQELFRPLSDRDRAESRWALHERLARAGARWLQRRLHTRHDRAEPCLGSRQAIALSILACTSAGDRIAADRLTDPRIRAVAELLDREVVSIEFDGEGTDPESLARVCRKDRPRLIYLMPALHNPTSVVTSNARRRDIAGVLSRFQIPFLEDDSRILDSTGEPSPLVNLRPGLGIYLAGSSKIFGSEIELSFLTVPEKLRDRFRAVIWATLPTMPESLLVAYRELIESGLADEALIRSQSILLDRRRIAAEILGVETIPSSTLSPYVWIELAPGREAEETAERVLEAGAKVLPSTPFTIDAGGPEAIRVSLSGPQSLSDLDRGLRHVVGALG